jgi:hypothetical protein
MFRMFWGLLAHAQVQTDHHGMQRGIPNAGDASDNHLITTANHHSMITRQNAGENAVNDEETYFSTWNMIKSTSQTRKPCTVHP